jgi:hypothetical protein
MWTKEIELNDFQEADVDEGNRHEFCWVYKGWCTVVT